MRVLNSKEQSNHAFAHVFFPPAGQISSPIIN